jgi:hypothetical protein
MKWPKRTEAASLLDSSALILSDRSKAARSFFRVVIT